MQVFISHSRKDEDLARGIADVLKESGLDVWDYSEILPGDNWAKQVAKALEESEAMVVLITPESLNSEFLKLEVDYALGKMAYSNRLIPVLVGDPQDFKKQDIPWIFQHLNMIHLPGNGQNKENIKQIAKAIKKAA